MGKGQRSQAASSHRASEMLSSSGAGGFVGFQTLGPTGLAAAGALDETEGISGEMRMVVGRLRKKDATTKLKSLQELQALLPASDEADVRALLVHWPRIFGRLSLDVDRRVRETAHTTMAVLASRAGRLLGTNIKELIGTWLCGQYDPSHSVAQQCSAALAATFPGEKMPRVLAVCRAELIALAQQNIVQATPQAFTDNPSVAEDPMSLSDKYERAVSSTIRVLADLLTGLPADAELVADTAELFSPAGVWRLLKHESGAIRGAVYALTAALATRADFLSAIPLKTIATALFTSGFSEKDASALRSCITAVTAATAAAPTLWTVLNTRKALVPALVALLRDGGRGCGELLFASLPAWVSAMPHEVFGDGAGFFEALFGALRQGLAAIRADRAAVAALHACYANLVSFVTGRPDTSMLAGPAVGHLVAVVHSSLPLLRVYPSAALQALFVASAADGSLNAALQVVARECVGQGNSAALADTMACDSLAALLAAALVSLPDPPETVVGTAASLVKTTLVAARQTPVLPTSSEEAASSNAGALSATEPAAYPSTHTSGALSLAVAVLAGARSTKIPPSTTIRVCSALGGPVNVWRELLAPVVQALLQRPASPISSDTVVRCMGMLAAAAAAVLAAQDPHDRTALAVDMLADEDKSVTRLWHAALLAHLAGLEPSLLPVLAHKQAFLTKTLSDTIAAKASDELSAALLLCLRNFHSLLDDAQFASICDQLVSSIEPYARAASPDAFATTAFRAVVNLAMLASLTGPTRERMIAAAFAAAHPTSNSTKLAADACWALFTQAAQSDGAVVAAVSRTLCEWSAAPNMQTACRAGRGLAWLRRVAGPAALDSVVNWNKPGAWALGVHADVLRCVQGLLPSSLLADAPLELLNEEESAPFAQMVSVSVLLYFLDALLSQANDEKDPALVALVATAAQGVSLLPVGSPEHSLLAAVFAQLSASQLDAVLASLIAQSASNHTASVFAGIRALAGPIATRAGPEAVCDKIASCIVPGSQTLAAAMALVESSALPPAALETLLTKTVDAIRATLSADAVALLVLLATKAPRPKSDEAISATIADIARHRDADGDLLAPEAPARMPLCIEAAKLFRLWVSRGPAASDPLWEFVLCNALAWLTIGLSGLPALALVSQTCAMAATIERCASKTSDWVEFFCPAISSALVPHFMAIPMLLAPQAATRRSKATGPAARPLLTATTAAARVWTAVAEAARLLCVEPLGAESLQASLDTLDVPLLSVQAATSVMLMRALQAGHVLPGLAERVTANFAAADAGGPARSRALFSWILLLAASKATTNSTVLAELSKALADLFPAYVELVFAAIPQHATAESLASGLDASFLTSTADFAEENPDGKIANIAVHSYVTTLAQVASLARQWWQESCPPKLTHRIAALHKAAVSPLLIARECAAIEACRTKPAGLHVQPRAGPREIAATFQVDEVKMDIVISLSETYPFGTISVTGTMDVLAKKQLNWCLQMQTFLMCQNGSIMNALETWTRNVSKHFEGADQCVVCYSVMHATSRQLPDKRCRTCRNPFHAACLYRWFSTSGQSSCPMCRNLF